MKLRTFLLMILPLFAFYWWRPASIPKKIEEVPDYLARKYPSWGKSANSDCIAFTFCMVNETTHVQLLPLDNRPDNALYVKEIKLTDSAIEEVVRQTGAHPTNHCLACLMPGEGDRKQSIALSQMLFNENTLHWLNNRRKVQLTNFPALLGRYAEWLRRHKLPPEDFCLDNGSVMALYGVRDTSDIDFVHIGHRRPIRNYRPEDFQSHNSVVESISGLPWTAEDIVTNPMLHFYYYGYKVASFDVMRRMKELRRRDKDLTDLEVMDEIEQSVNQGLLKERLANLDAAVDYLNRKYPSWGASLKTRAESGALTTADRDTLALTFCMNREDCRLVLQESEPAAAVYSKKLQLTKQGQAALAIAQPSTTVWLIEGSADSFRNETVDLAPILLNDNSLHFLNFRKQDGRLSFSQRFDAYKTWIADARLPSDELCVESGAVLAAYGLRDSGDIDVLHISPCVVLDRRIPPGCGSHNAEALKYNPLRAEDIITNPELHFTYQGQKFATLQVVRAMKQKRAGRKDALDLALIDQFLAETTSER